MRLSEQDLTGQVFGYLSVLRRSSRKHHWVCLCICGKECDSSIYALRKGAKRSCGCRKREFIAEKKTTHGLYGTPIYMCWASMKQRCLYEKSNRYKTYGERGIAIYPEWIKSFASFNSYIVSHLGEHPGKGWSIDRIDVNRGYEPGNIRWANNQEQARNKTNTLYLEFKGEKKDIFEWSESTGIKYNTLLNRYHRGWSTTDILTVPVLNGPNAFHNHPNRNIETKRRGGKHKLTPSDVTEIRRLLSGKVTLHKIAERFNIGITAVSNIKAGKTWSKVP